MRTRLILLLLLIWTHQAQGQWLSTFFPEGVPGYGDAGGVTVRSRVRPAYEPLGIHVDTVMIRPVLSQSIGYDDNIFGGPVRRGAWEIATRPSVLVGTERSRGSFGFFASADDIRYLNQSAQDRTDGSAFAGGTLNFGRDKLTLGGGYLARHQDRTELDALPSDRPVAFQVENVRASYAADLGLLKITPSIDLNRWRFENTTILGVPVSEATRDRTTAAGEMTLRYAWMPARDLLLVTRAFDTHYDHPARGVAANDSTSWRMLLGGDYDDNTIWRYRLLGGVEYRAAGGSGIASQIAGILEADVIWSPSGLTTLRAAINRGIEDAAQTGLSSFTYTSATLTMDHELFRNVLLNGAATARQASYNQTGGEQRGLALGLGATWLIDRNFRLSVSYDFADVRNFHLPSGTVAGNYARDLTLLTLRIGL